MVEKVKVGIIGCGRISDLHRLGYLNNDRAEIIAVCDSVEDKAKRKSREWNVEKYYTDYRQLLEDEQINTVEILTPHFTHAEIAIAAAKMGKHISLQKVPTLTIKEIDEVIKSAQEARVKLKIFEEIVFYPPIMEAKKLIKEGEIGEPITIRIKSGSCGKGRGWELPPDFFEWRRDLRKSGGGSFTFDDGYHKCSLARYLMGDIEKVYAWIGITKRGNRTLDAPSVVMWKYKDEEKYGIWDIVFSPETYIETKYFHMDDRVEITGTKGIIWVTRCSARLLDVPALVLYKDGKVIGFQKIKTGWEQGFINSSHHFINCVLEDKQPILTGEEGKKNLQLALAIQESARTHKEVAPDSIK